MADEFLSSSDLKVINKWIKKLEEKYYDSKKNKDVARSNLKLPYKEIGAGVHRIVFDLKNGTVLKVAITKSGLRNNKNEAEIYRTFNSPLKAHLAKVLGNGHGWIIMEKINQELSQTAENCDRVYKLREMFLAEGMRSSDIVRRSKKEAKWKNVRSRGDMIIVIDYGPFRYYGTG